MPPESPPTAATDDALPSRPGLSVARPQPGGAWSTQTGGFDGSSTDRLLRAILEGALQADNAASFVLQACAADATCLPEGQLDGQLISAWVSPLGLLSPRARELIAGLPLSALAASAANQGAEGAGPDGHLACARLYDLACSCRAVEFGAAQGKPDQAAWLQAQTFAQQAVIHYLRAIATSEPDHLPPQLFRPDLEPPDSDGEGLEQPRTHGWLLRAAQLAVALQLDGELIEALRGWLPRAANACLRAQNPACTLHFARACLELSGAGGRGLVDVVVQGAERAAFQARFHFARSLYDAALQVVTGRSGDDDGQLLALDQALTLAEEACFRDQIRSEPWISKSLLDHCANELARIGAPSFAINELRQARAQVGAAAEKAVSFPCLVPARDRLLQAHAQLEHSPGMHLFAAVPLGSRALLEVGRSHAVPAPAEMATRASVAARVEETRHARALERSIEHACTVGLTMESRGFLLTEGEECVFPDADLGRTLHWYAAAEAFAGFVLDDLRVAIAQNMPAVRVEVASLIERNAAKLGSRRSLFEHGVLACVEGDFERGIALLVPQLTSAVDAPISWDEPTRHVARWLLCEPHAPGWSAQVAKGDPRLWSNGRCVGNMCLWLGLRILLCAQAARSLRQDLRKWIAAMPVGVD